MVNGCKKRNVGLLFISLGAVTAASLLTVFDALSVQSSTNHLIANARKVSNTTAANQDDAVFLKVMTFAWNVDCNFFAVGQTHTSDLTKSRVRFLRGHRTNVEADAALLRALIQNRGFAELARNLAILTN